ncbi:MAG: PepSY domain-containing protein [Methylicorpusculum sp.]|uniref:PepSY domain-containing protein n=1 Tax=Methylicorpusculum sp. TaxID=2713644 RepID=UPI00271EAEEF|nr:PepSY domain-containing protein [Methylicorpusculum sp.]MDO8844580.1 PepSY domain-containing protein [Methylicorpusculum sp.]MDO8939844.1 PepSY domain-containing protein [Methylicorpusculum sp.]MDO9240390.1 PepSY domain-containing protein [Methylicorpusculum sp.]MDP2178572.1 PepSY domain-containing protein [Methylicorpusculum sp.]MDP2202973.1 PepSY domain-containing protein [Methylicorpusculum sp.]
MKKQLISGVMLLSLNAVIPVSVAGDQALEDCLAEVKKEKTGTVLKLEKLNVSGKPFYEVEVKDANGFEWEFMCDAVTGKITETESEVADPKSQAFKQKAKITEEDAAKIALKAYPGKIEEVEYEIEKDGSASFEFDIVSEKGVETKVEVDAATGKIIEVSIEEWEIGEESDEKR